MKGAQAALALALMAAPAGAAPDFIPSPKQAFEGFVAIGTPRPEVPVGALWIDGFGPTGEGAAADNLETVRSLNGVSIDKSFQVNLSAGLLELIGIDPRYRDRFTARFTDLAIVRVKDHEKLAGPKGEPRIVEAIKAGLITVSSDGEMGLAGQTLGWRQRSFDGNGTTGRVRNYSIEGRDMFIAVRVATLKLTHGPETELRLNFGESISARIDDFRIELRQAECRTSDPEDCAPLFAVTKLSSHPPASAEEFVGLAPASTVELDLPVPVADHHGGLYDAVVLRWVAPCGFGKVRGCGRRPRLFAAYQGSRLEDLKSPDGKGW